MMQRRWVIFALVALVFLLWSTPAMLPLKILVVFFHELSHGLAAILSGGRIESISVSANQGGLTVTRGGNLFLITSAGYLGSLLIGVLIFLTALKSRADKAMMAALGGVLLLVTGLYIREPFALGFTIAAGVAMLASAQYLSTKVNDMALRVIGLTSMIYVPFDIFSDTILRSAVRSDAYNLALQFGGTAWLWGGLWLLVSLAVIWKAMSRGLR